MISPVVSNQNNETITKTTRTTTRTSTTTTKIGATTTKMGTTTTKMGTTIGTMRTTTNGKDEGVASGIKQQYLCFLDAYSHLYKRVCPSTRMSVHPSVRPYVCPFPLALKQNHRKPPEMAQNRRKTMWLYTFPLWTHLFTRQGLFFIDAALHTCWMVGSSVSPLFHPQR